jgi:lipoate-protein ligase B
MGRAEEIVVGAQSGPPGEWLETIRIPTSVSYEDVYKRQLRRRHTVATGESPNGLYLCEHPPTITLGRNAHEHHLLRSRAQLANAGIEVVEVDRGGDVTYHGPGQLVAYPILNLAQWRRSISWYLRELEAVLIDVLAGFGLKGERLEKHTGVWIGGAKVAAIGVGIHNWVTYHGLALNVAPNMEHWSYIVPCGIPDKPVTSLDRFLGIAPGMPEVMDRFDAAFRGRFGETRGRH